MPLVDLKGRVITYLRLSVTDRCNYRCTYCMPAAGFPRVGRDEILSLEELARLVKVFAGLGVTTVRITGGEPTVRGGLLTLVRAIRDEAGIGDIALTTNADRLAELAGPLAEAGVTRVNISFDTLSPERHAQLTRGGKLSHVLAGIEAARSAGFRAVKLNTVVVGGTNDDEAEALCDFAWARGLTPRFIELMPLGEAGRMHGRQAVVPTAELLRRLAHRLEATPAADAGLPGQGPAVYHRRVDGPGVAGFIGAVTEKFCSGCNRVRLTSKGELRGCLARPEGADLRALIRAGVDDDGLADAIRFTVLGRKDGHRFWDADADPAKGVVMTGVGG